MIDLHLYAAFVAAVTVLMLIPGPNVALIVQRAWRPCKKVTIAQPRLKWK